jgi:ribosomal protection tetracycline resistance protein
MAHVDAGKTTTTEQMLYLSGRIRTPGRVDDGTAQTDYLEVERQRGITVRTAATALPWKGCNINLVDTPGHTDFVAEVERSLRVLDGAVLIISAAEGVQAHTETLWHALRTRRVPTLVFINKVDRFGASPERVLGQVRRMLTERAVPVQALPATEHDFHGVAPLDEAALLEALADWDDAALERYAGGCSPATAAATAPANWALGRLAELTRACEAVPVLFGSSLKGLGVAELLDAILALLPGPAPLASPEPAGVIFKVEADPVMGRVAYARIFAGVIPARGSIRLNGRPEPTKVAAIRRMYARHHEDLPALAAGDVGVLCGLGAVRAGDTFGAEELLPPLHRLARPVLSVRAWPEREQDQTRLLLAMQTLVEEDPSLQMNWVPAVRELTLTVVGPVQVEIVQALLQTRFRLGARFSPPSVIYRETPVGRGEAQVSYRPSQGYAWLHMRVEPGEPGSGVTYIPLNRHDDLYPQFEAEVRRTVLETLDQGLMGWQVTDVRVSLLGGAFDAISTTVGNYTGATPIVLMAALEQAGTRLLEPLYQITVSVPEFAAGRVTADLGQRRAVIREISGQADRIIIEGTLPVAEALDLPAKLSGMSGGRGIVTMHPGGFQPAPPGTRAEIPRADWLPPDPSRYRIALPS